MSSSRDHRKQLYERLVGQTVANGRFEITDLLGFGGMGAVYEAIQKNMDRKVALKLIPTHDPTIVARFEREALTISNLKHPNTITVFDFGQSEDGFLFLSMELLEGQTLTDEIKQGPMSAKRAVHIASQMCRSLAEAHKAGIVHRDIKPDNIILIRVDDDPDVVKVLDFGIAKAVMGEDDVQLTGDGRIIGTPRYMSPEQILAEPLDHRSDIYSLGCILFEMLCGAPPFQQSSTTALMISHTQDPPPAFAAQLDTGMMSQVPAGLERVVRRALAKRPEDRPDDCDQLRDELEQAMAGDFPDEDAFETVDSMPLGGASGKLIQGQATESGPLPVQDERHSSKGLVVGIIALLVLILGMVALQQLQGDDADAVAAADPDAVQDVTSTVEDVVDEVEEELEPEEAVLPPALKAGVPVATINLTSEPVGAKIYEGSSFLGTTPMSFPVKAEFNKHGYKLVKDGYEDLEVVVAVSPKDKDAEVNRQFELKRKRVAKRPASNPKPPKKKPTKPDSEPEEKVEPKDTTPNVPRLDDGPKADVKRIE